MGDVEHDLAAWVDVNADLWCVVSVGAEADRLLMASGFRRRTAAVLASRINGLEASLKL
jgi:hypothetical protein